MKSDEIFNQICQKISHFLLRNKISLNETYFGNNAFPIEKARNHRTEKPRMYNLRKNMTL